MLVGQKIIPYEDIVDRPLIVFDERIKVYSLGVQGRPNTRIFINS